MEPAGYRDADRTAELEDELTKAQARAKAAEARIAELELQRDDAVKRKQAWVSGLEIGKRVAAILVACGALVGVALLLAFWAKSCEPSHVKTHDQDGNEVFSVSCYTDMSECYKHIGDVCGARGYTTSNPVEIAGTKRTVQARCKK